MWTTAHAPFRHAWLLVEPVSQYFPSATGVVPQEPPEHEGVAQGFEVVHACWHPPQLSGSVLVETHIAVALQ
jgi:hypothetical protein